MCGKLFSAVLGLVLVSSASAQVIYEPLRVQYGEARPYYYGGSDPQIHRMAERADALNQLRPISEQSPRVFSDFFPGIDGRYFNFTASDAINQANAELPLFFRKRDLLSGARMSGRWITIPSRPEQVAPGTISIRPWVARPVEKRSIPALVIPKELMDRKVMPSDKLSASAT